MGFLRAQKLDGARQAEQHLPLVKQRRFRAVEVLGLFIRVERAAAEADNAIALILDREH